MRVSQGNTGDLTGICTWVLRFGVLSIDHTTVTTFHSRDNNGGPQKWSFNLEYFCDGFFSRRFANVRNRKKCDRKKFQWLYSDYSHDEFSQKFFNFKNFSVEVSWHFRKFFSAQNNSSLQYVLLMGLAHNWMMSMTSIRRLRVLSSLYH